ncbi:MAG TPA: SRPBCC family protein, partial [Nocardioides sp.]|nr:SRPBCC family protein [Nocardioides sp.]
MQLSHSFAVPSSIDTTWASFQDIGALAECFPGAQVTSVGETEDGAPTFEGTCKVKLGPIALVYAGAGSFVERDEAGHRFVVDAKGRDKRGNGTAGAKVTVTMAPAEQGTQVDVRTDLAITGKPAQFGRGVMQDVSDKLLGQFVACLEQRLAAESGTSPADGESAPAADSAASPAPSSPA